MPRHRRFVTVYTAYLARHRQVDINGFYGVFQSVASTGFHPFNGESTSWDIARSLPSAIAIPLDERIAIERVYAEQSQLHAENGRIVDDLHITATVEYPNLYLPMGGIRLDASDVVADEERLLRLDDLLLKRLPNT